MLGVLLPDEGAVGTFFSALVHMVPWCAFLPTILEFPVSISKWAVNSCCRIFSSVANGILLSQFFY